MAFAKINRYQKLLLAFVLLASNFVFLANFVNAASLTNSYIRLTRMKAATTSSFRLQIKAVSSQTANVTIDFNGTDTGTAQWTNATPGGLVNATQTVTTATCASETGDTALPGSITAAGSGGVVTISSVGATTSGVTYCADLTSASAVTTPIAGEYHPTITMGTDSITIALRTISNDQVVVNATVPPSFNFQISACTPDNFTANLSPTTHISTTGCTITVNTNAKNGWFAWAKDSNTGLLSSTASHTITPSTAGAQADLNTTHGAEGYGIGITSLSQGGSCAGTCGTTSAIAAYDSTASAGVNGLVGGVDTTNRMIASSTGIANGATITVKARANINATTPPATDYTDTLTYIGAGYF